MANKALCTAYLMFLGRAQYERGQLVLRGLQTIMKESLSSSDVKKMANFEICRAQGVGYYKEGKYAAALKELNAAIASCPKVQGAFADGLSDTLVILSESYSRLAK
ncbi:hypothetical protein EON65_13715 [archaeon]|nr:MAG: hypothetical protein EON65_13715 [archaeon]